jgi:hypothetical protein
MGKKVVLVLIALLLIFFVSGAWKFTAPWLIERATNIPQLSSPANSGSNPDKNTCQGKSLATPELIDCARTAGKITKGQRILYLHYALDDYEKLPPEYKSNDPWEGTLIALNVSEAISSAAKFCTFSKEIQTELRKSYPQAVDCTNTQVVFKGWLTTIWGDDFKNKETVRYTISDGKESYKLKTTDEVPSLTDFDRKEVQITGLKTTEPNTIMVISIKTVGAE